MYKYKVEGTEEIKEIQEIEVNAPLSAGDFVQCREPDKTTMYVVETVSHVVTKSGDYPKSKGWIDLSYPWVRLRKLGRKIERKY